MLASLIHSLLCVLFQQPAGTSRDRENRVPRHLRTTSIRADDELPQLQLDRAAHALRSQFGKRVASFVRVTATLVIQFHVLQALLARLDTSERLVTSSARFLHYTVRCDSMNRWHFLHIVAQHNHRLRDVFLRLSSFDDFALSSSDSPSFEFSASAGMRCDLLFHLTSFTHSPRHSSSHIFPRRFTRYHVHDVTSSSSF